jgi:hypothetical protein
MALIDNPNNPSRKKRTAASALNKQYALLVPGRSFMPDFQSLINKGIPVDQIRLVMASIAKLPADRRPGSHAMIKRWNYWVERAVDSLEGYRITDKATLLANHIADSAEPIPVEYVQHTMDVYAEFLSKLRFGDEFAKSVWGILPTPEDFVIYWYGKKCAKFSPSYRKFRIDHEVFTEFGGKIAKNLCGDYKRWGEMVKTVCAS